MYLFLKKEKSILLLENIQRKVITKKESDSIPVIHHTFLLKLFRLILQSIDIDSSINMIPKDFRCS